MLQWFRRFFRKTEQHNLNTELLAQIRGGIPVTAGVRVNEATALNLTSVFAAVRVISETVASIPFPVFRRMDNGGKERDRNHAVHVLLNRSPDGEISSMQWREAKLGHVLTWGNAFSEIVKSGKTQTHVSLHLISPNKVNPERTKSGQLVYKIDGSVVRLPADRMLH